MNVKAYLAEFVGTFALVFIAVGAIVADQGNVDLPFIVTGLSLLLLAPALATIKPTKPMQVPPEGATTQWGLLKRPPALAAIVLMAALTLPVGLYDAIWAILMEDRGASTLFTGITLSLYGLPFILVAPFGIAAPYLVIAAAAVACAPVVARLPIEEGASTSEPGPRLALDLLLNRSVAATAAMAAAAQKESLMVPQHTSSAEDDRLATKQPGGDLHARPPSDPTPSI